MWYFKEIRIPPLLPPHPSSLAAVVHDCLFSIFTVNPHFWGPFGYPQPADALGSFSSLLSAMTLLPAMNASGAGRNGWAPTNSANLYGGDGGVVCVGARVCTRECAFVHA